MSLNKRALGIGLAVTGLCCAGALWAAEPSPAVTSRIILKTTRAWDGTPIVYPQGTAEVTGIMVTLAPGAQTGWHAHPVPSFGMVLEGELEVELQDGRRLTLKAGDGLAEVFERAHNGRNTGSVPMKVLVFYAGVADQPLTQMLPAPAR
jgi:quercetin dioxygenase-like cupin family protein